MEVWKVCSSSVTSYLERKAIQVKPPRGSNTRQSVDAGGWRLLMVKGPEEVHLAALELQRGLAAARWRRLRGKVTAANEVNPRPNNSKTPPPILTTLTG